MIPDPSLPPAILVGIDTPIGLAVLRELGQHGVAVHGLAAHPGSIGLRSRFLHRGHVRSGPLDAQLRAIAAESGARFVLTVSMHDAIAVREAADRDALGTLHPLLAALPQLHLVNDKLEICRIAQTVGIETPFTWQPEITAAEAIPDRLTYPAVLKWRDPEQAYPALDAAGISFHKSEYAHDRAALAAALARYRPIGQFPMVQSYCPGYGLGQMLLMRRDAAVMRFQHRRVAEWPPEGGSSSCCISISLDEHAGLRARSEALLRKIGWEGPAMVEYRVDPATGSARLMEINGRFWGSLPLASAAGVPFGWGTYVALGLDSVPGAAPYHGGVRCRYMVPHTRRLLRILFQPSRIPDRSLRFSKARELFDYVVEFFRPGSRYYVFSWSDPGPFLADIRAILAKMQRGIRARLPIAGARATSGSRHGPRGASDKRPDWTP